MFATIGDNTKHNHRKHPLIVGCLLLGLAAVPDAMVVPVLHELTVDRFGVSEGSAHCVERPVEVYSCGPGLAEKFQRAF